MIKKLILFLILAYSLIICSSDYDFTDLIDIGRSQGLLFGGFISTKTGIYDVLNGNQEYFGYDGNMKHVVFSEDKFLVSDYGNSIDLYNYTDTVINYEFTYNFNENINRIAMSGEFSLIKTDDALYLMKNTGLTLQHIRGFNLSYVDNFYSFDTTLLFIRHGGENILYGKMVGDTFVNVNSINTNKVKFILQSKFGDFIINSDLNEITYCRIQNGELHVLYAIPFNRNVKNGFKDDTLLLFYSNDSIFVCIQTDTFIMSTTDSFPINYPVKTVKSINNKLYLLGEKNLTVYNLITKGFEDSSLISLDFKSVINVDSGFILFNTDSLYTYHDDLENINKTSNYLYQKNQFIMNSDSSITFSYKDTINNVKTYCIPTSSEIVNDTLYYSDKYGMVFKTDIRLSSLHEHYFTFCNPIYDFEIDGNRIIAVNGLFGISSYTSDGTLSAASYSKGIYTSIYGSDNEYIAVMENSKLLYFDSLLSQTDSVTGLKINSFNRSDSKLLISTEDSVIIIDSLVSSLKITGGDYRGFEIVSINEKDGIAIMENGAVIRITENLTSKKDDEHGLIISVNHSEYITVYDMSGRVVNESGAFDINSLKSGIYFIKRPDSLKLQKYLNIR